MHQILEKFIALSMLLLCLPLAIIIFLLVKIDSPGPFIFRQKRAGKNKKPFTMYKIRTMVVNAEKIKSKYLSLNEADGPVFKIRDDPRYTRIGKILSHTAIDELPQLINVVTGNMALVGPRPLPLNEAAKVPKKYSERFSIMPGMTSPWIINGAHNLTFKQWMELDVKYVRNRSALIDINIFLKTLLTRF